MMEQSIEHILAIRFARAYIGYVTGLSEATMIKQIPDDAEVGELWMNVAKLTLIAMKEPDAK